METALLTTIIASIFTAFAFGIATKKLHLLAIFGYLLAGAMLSIVVNPFLFRWFDRKIAGASS
jgi:predicted Kef-type K+ transport protein